MDKGISVVIPVYRGEGRKYLYEAGRLDTRLPFAELQRRAHVNARAQKADQAEDFSRRIRAEETQ